MCSGVAGLGFVPLVMLAPLFSLLIVLGAMTLAILWGASLVAFPWDERLVVYLLSLTLSSLLYAMLLKAPFAVAWLVYGVIPILSAVLLIRGRRLSFGCDAKRVQVSSVLSTEGAGKPGVGVQGPLLLLMTATVCACAARLFASFMGVSDAVLAQDAGGWLFTAVVGLVSLVIGVHRRFAVLGKLPAVPVLLLGGVLLLFGMLVYLGLGAFTTLGTRMGYLSASASARLLEVLGLLYASEVVLAKGYPRTAACAVAFLAIKMVTPFFTILSEWALGGVSSHGSALVSTSTSLLTLLLVFALIGVVWKTGGRGMGVSPDVAAVPSDCSDCSEALTASDVSAVFDTFASTHGLTDRESQVTRAIVDGGTVKAASLTLGVSQNTVQTHLKSIYRKTGVHSRTELVNLLWKRN